MYSLLVVYVALSLTIGEELHYTESIALPCTHKEIKDKVLGGSKSVNQVTAGSKLACLHVSMLFLIC